MGQLYLQKTIGLMFHDENDRKAFVNSMARNRMIILIVGLVLVFVLAIFTGFNALNRDGLIFIPFLVVLVYFAYILKQVYEEWNLFRMDKKNGVEIKVLEFLDLSVSKCPSERKYMPKLIITLALFKDQLKQETLALKGDFSCIELKPGRKYTVTFYRNIREIVKIEEYKRTKD